jgi:ribonuclease P protein component
MTDPIQRRSERLERAHRIRLTREYARVKAGARAIRGACCLLLALEVPGEDTRIGFIASKRSVGGAVQRNRARRRLRETVRRRWPDLPRRGWWLVFIAHRPALTLPQPALTRAIDEMLTQAGALPPGDRS